MFTGKIAKVVALLPLVLYLALAGCADSARRKEGIEALTQTQAAVHGLHILVSAGLTKAEYSQRLEDMLLKAGDLNESENQTLLKFPQKEQGNVRDIYTHLSASIEAFKTARDYFGDKFDAIGCENGCMTLSQQDYDTEKTAFPTLSQLQPVKSHVDLFPNSSPEYFRHDMLQALWKIAGDEEISAKTLLETMQHK